MRSNLVGHVVWFGKDVVTQPQDGMTRFRRISHRYRSMMHKSEHLNEVGKGVSFSSGSQCLNDYNDDDTTVDCSLWISLLTHTYLCSK